MHTAPNRGLLWRPNMTQGELIARGVWMQAAQCTLPTETGYMGEAFVSVYAPRLYALSKDVCPVSDVYACTFVAYTIGIKFEVSQDSAGQLATYRVISFSPLLVWGSNGRIVQWRSGVVTWLQFVRTLHSK